ncbi:hypothetical protein M0R45_027991 [Rubus argutus]|uniref:non-specific serine/threonine protein kinase n=1 Tax=Rubus argutus TaxID=59490 RepID=A0AAW1W7Z6_RUBAR
MPTLSILDLSNNSLTGRIPESFGSSPALEMLNLSFNRLEGPVPANGIWITINPNDLVGNAGLCGGILPPCSQSSTGNSRSASEHAHQTHHYRIHNRNRSDYISWRSVFHWGDGNQMSLAWVGLELFTRPKSIDRIQLWAVKKLWRPGTDVENGEDLFGEVNLLGRLRHRNIVRLLGHQSYTEISNRTTLLLDKNLDARIADFGLARMMTHKNETVSMVAGSYGYIAPEYGYAMKVDEKTDIYSYGVVLLELLTGKMPVDPAFGESVDIVEWVRRKMRNKRALEAALDSSIAGECKHVQEEMLLVLRIALLFIGLI